MHAVEGMAAGGTSRIVARTALLARLPTPAPGSVTLVSAPAGSGKTILLRSWIESIHLADRTAWVTVERDEHDAQHFWLSVIHALRAVAGADGVVEQRSATPEFEGQAVVERLGAGLRSLKEPVLLVIDDLHELRTSEALAEVGVLLARQPPQLRVVLATRHDPPFRLHRHRLAGRLVEVRAADLRFTLDETRELLTASGITLSAGALARLHARTEGWAAGLRLAALSLAGHPRPERFVDEFSGSDRTVAEYLLAEVLERQPDELRTLLLRTSILERVNGALADRLLGTTSAEGMLLELEQANAFVVAVDPARSWFRYHPLFADLLALELRRTDPDAVPKLHRAAAEWYAGQGYAVDAIRHAQAAGDWAYATRLLAEHGFSLSLDGQGATIGALLAAFPADALSEPELAASLAYQELTQRSLDNGAAYLALAGRRASEVPEDRRRRFRVILAVARLALARQRGDLDAVLSEVRPLLEPVAADTISEVTLGNDARAVALMNLGIAELWSARPDDGERHLEQALELARRIGRAYVEVACLSHLAVAAARHSVALERERSSAAVAIAEAHGWASDSIASIALAAMGGAEVVQGRFEDGGRWLDRAEQSMRPDVEPATALLLAWMRGLQHIGEGRLEQAAAEFRTAVRFQERLTTRHVVTGLAREYLALTQLRLGDAVGARATLGQLTDDEREWGEARAALASLHLAEGDAAAAIEVLAPVLAEGVPKVRVAFSLIQAYVVDAIARDRLGDRQAAESDIERALDLAEPGGVVLPFLITPPDDLLGRHPRHRTAHGALLADILDVLTGSSLPTRAAEPSVLPEALSEAELRVLRYLPSNLSASEIGAELFISTSTVKTHMRHIYDKLDAHRRTEAVERAREVGLLAPATRGHR